MHHEDPILPAGKLPPELLRELLQALPPMPREVLLGPAVGEDACAIELNGGVLVAAADPITLTGAGVGAHAVVINANDIAVMGVRPRWFLATVLLPVGTRASEVRALFQGMVAGLAALDVALVGGHTEVTAAVNQPVVSGQMMGHASREQVRSSGGMHSGQVLVQVGSAPVEGVAVLAEAFAARLDQLPEPVLRAAQGALIEPGISVVEQALTAARFGATAMHDPTESGLSAGMHEMAAASGVALRVRRDALLWYGPGLQICAALGVNPLGLLASGALLAAFDAAEAWKAIAHFTAAGIPAAVIAEAADGEGVRFEDGAEVPQFTRDELARVLESA